MRRIKYVCERENKRKQKKVKRKTWMIEKRAAIAFPFCGG